MLAVSVLALLVFLLLTGMPLVFAMGLASTAYLFFADISAAVTVASAMVGPIIPPSIGMVIYGALADVSIGRLLLAGILPGFTIIIVQMIFNWFLARRRGYPRYPRASLHEAACATWRGTPREMLAQLALDTTQIMASGDPGIKEIEYLALPYLMRGIANYAALGAKPTPIAFKEVYTALPTGVVDGQENPIETIHAQKFYEVQKAIAMVDYIDKPAYVMVGDVFWQGLSEADRALFKKAQAASRALVEGMLPTQQKEFLEKMQASGVTITYPDKAEFVAATQKVRDKLGIDRWGEETYKKIVEIGQKQIM